MNHTCLISVAASQLALLLNSSAGDCWTHWSLHPLPRYSSCQASYGHCWGGDVQPRASSLQYADDNDEDHDEAKHDDGSGTESAHALTNAAAKKMKLKGKMSLLLSLQLPHNNILNTPR